MGLYRDESGRLLELDDSFASARGYVPAEATDLGAVIDDAGERYAAEQRGVAGDINAVATGTLSGLTFGLSDMALANALTPLERERLAADLRAHPNLRTGGEIIGGIAGAVAAPGSLLARTPAGYLGNVAAREVESGLARGGVGGVGRALNAMGLEGAAQSAGQYIGHAAIEDKEVTAEALAGAVGTGYAFGSLGGGAALGVVKGTMAARRLYSRVMDGRRGAQAAESSWKLASQEALDSDIATRQVAETKLDEIRKAKIAAQRERNAAKAGLREEQMSAAAEKRVVTEDGTVAPEMEGPEPLIDVGPQPTGNGGVTSQYQKPAGMDFDPAEAAAFDGSMPSMRDQVNDLAGTIKPSKDGAKTGAYKATTQRIQRGAPDEVAPPATDLEAQLAGTKAKLDEGQALRDIKAGDRPALPDEHTPGNTYPGRERDIKGQIFEMQRQGRTKEGMQAARQEALRDIQYKATEDLLGAPAAKLERELQEVVDEYNDARKALGELSDGIPEPLDGGEISRAVDPYGKTARAGTKNVTPRARQARQILDDAHEESLLRAKYAADPAEAGKALSEAEELENLLNQIDDVSDGVPRMVDGSTQEMFADQLAADIKKLWRYEEASAKLSDLVGEAAHPTSLAKAKAFRDAEKDSARKVTERSARAIDDVEHFDAPKDRVKAARGRYNEAQSSFDELKIQETEARDAFGKAKRKVTEGEKAKRAALSADKAAASAAGKLGAADAGGMLEILNLPGLPKPSDLPIVGPLLGAYLKFRTLKKSMGRFMGKVPATADARAAAQASQTRDRIARAVDRSLGFVEKTGKFASRKMAPTAGILANRIFDDGGEDPGKKASVTKQAAARMREIAAYVHTPNAIELDVRRELRGVTDPDLITAAEKHRRFMFEYILKHMPKTPDQGLLKTNDWEPSAGQAMSLARRMEALNDPPGVFEKLAQERDLVSLEAAETLRDVYPRLFQEALRRATERAHEAPGRIPYRTRVQMSVFYQQPFEPALEPENFQITQSVYERKPSSPAFNPAVPGASAPPGPTVAPSVAQPTDLAQQYMPSFDRR